MSAMLGRALPPLPGEVAPAVLQPAPTKVLVDFLLPTGVIVPMQCNQRSTLRQVKVELFREAKGYPLFSLLKEKGFYNFVGKREETLETLATSVVNPSPIMHWGITCSVELPLEIRMLGD